jgi:putative oxygen-independent coproporphyrinogen III oxidase
VNDLHARSGRWSADPGFGVYVHIPFCRHRCHYCDFNTYEGQEALHAAYVDALVRHIEESPGEARSVTSIFFGGGTPTLLSARDLGRILEAVRNRMDVSACAEVTVEANPETVTEATFEALLAAGFNRFSIGVQSLAPHVLRGLGRTHSAGRALDAIADARRAGVTDLNADLIFGSPWERPGDWVASLAALVDMGPEHVSAYALTVEPGTPLATLVRTGRVPDVDPDVQADRYATAGEVLGAAGYERYEVSNWARPGHASRHNVLYWSAGDYLGFGAGAHGHVAGRRSWAVRLPRHYVDAVGSGEVEEGHEVLTPGERAGEALALGLRLASGIEVAGFTTRFGDAALADRAADLDRLEAANLLNRSNGHIRISEWATLLGNEVTAPLL